jgi:hypothetical protein
MRKMIAGLAAFAVLGVAGCEMPEEPESYSEQGKTTQEATDTTASTKPKKKARPRWIGKMNAIHIGMPQATVKGILGKPDETDSMETENFEGGTTVMDSWTYGDMFSSADGDDLWMLSFTDGKLDSKSRM